MKKLQWIAALVLFVNCAEAQQKPYYTQYILNNYILNPALSGIENYVDVKLSYRKQWADIPGSPQTSYFSIQGPLNKSDYKVTPTSFVPQGENARGNTYLEDNVAAAPHHGLGMIIMNDKTGYINRFSMYASYAYHMSMSVKTNLALGFMAGFTNVNLDRSKINWGDLNPRDQAVGYSNGELKKFVPELGAGLWLYSPDYFVGASVLNIVPGKAKFAKAGNYGTSYSPNIFLSGGYRFPLNDDLHVLPSVALQWINPLPLQIHANVKLQYEDKLWFGASYRYSDLLGGFAAMAGINIFNAFNVGYSYDFATTSRLSAYTGNTHEIIIGFLLGNKYGDSCPRNIW
jgi:type IX secretion system PorP/SprF family membrane protein